MANPTISTIGTNDGLLLITDQDGVVYRVPKISVSSIIDSSNTHAFRLEIMTAASNIVLLFTTDALKNTFIGLMDAEY